MKQLRTHTKLLLVTGCFFSSVQYSNAQLNIDLRKDNTNSEEAHTFSINAEFRPRAEYRNGFKQLRQDTLAAAFFVSERSRINIGYETKKFLWYTSLQDVRVWGEDDPRSTDGTVQIFESYVEPSFGKNFSVRIGRQRIMYDNQRLFAENNWRQTGGSHDAVRFRYHPAKWTTELSFAFNQSKEQVFTTDFAPTTFTNYKFLAVHYLNYVHKKKIGFTTINAADGFQDSKSPEKLNVRYTSGGRIEVFLPAWYFTVSGYHQYGRNQKDVKLAATYLQPEIKYTGLKRFTFRLGAQYFTGNDATETGSTTDHSFVPLYGTNHSFAGSMEYFTSYPGDLNNGGLINPYLYTTFDINKKLSIRADFHQFYSENNIVSNKVTIDKYLGFENDWTLSYGPNAFTKIEFGVSWMSPTKSMEIVKKSGNSELTPYWSYLMLTFKPELIKVLF